MEKFNKLSDYSDSFSATVDETKDQMNRIYMEYLKTIGLDPKNPHAVSVISLSVTN